MKLRFRLDQQDGWPPADSEGVWAKPLGNGRFRVDNTPWFARGVAADDIVEAEVGEDGQNWVTGRHASGGHLTVRVVPFRAGHLHGSLQAVLDAFAPLGITGEGIQQYGIVALDIPPDASLGPVKQLLKAGAADGWWDFEEGSVSGEWIDLP